MSELSTVLSTEEGRQGAAKALRTLADQVERRDVSAVAWSFIFDNPLEFGMVNGGMCCSAGRTPEAYAEMGQSIAIDCEDHDWKTPWG